MYYRYVNTASSPGGDGTTNATTGVNRAYASLNEAEAGEQTTLTDAITIYCSGGQDDTAVTFDGWSGNSSTNTITIAGHPDDRHSGEFSSSHYYLDTETGDDSLSLRVDYVIVEYLQFKRKTSNDSSAGLIYLYHSANTNIKNCIFDIDYTASSTLFFIYIYRYSSNTTIENNIINGDEGSYITGVRIVNYNVNPIYIQDNTINNCNVGFQTSSYDEVNVRRNIIKNSYSTAIYFYTGSSSYGSGAVENNICYNESTFTDSSTSSGIKTRSVGEILIQHNTISGFYYGMEVGSSSDDSIYRNNIVQSCDYVSKETIGTFATGTDYNVCDDANGSGDYELPGSNNKFSTTITFDDAASGDFHTSDTDAQVSNNLYSDADYPVTDDADGEDRPSTGDVYAGAYEYVESGVTGTGSGDLASVTGEVSGTVVVGGSGAGTLAAITGSATGSTGSSVTGTATGELPGLEGEATGTVAINGTASGDLVSLSGEATGSVEVSGSATGTLKTLTGEASGTVVVSSSGAGILESIAGVSSGSVAIDGSGQSEFAPLTGQAEGQVSVTGTATGALEPLEGSATGYVSEDGLGTSYSLISNTIVLPSYSFDITKSSYSFNIVLELNE